MYYEKPPLLFKIKLLNFSTLLKTLKRNDIASYFFLILSALLFRLYTFTHLDKIPLNIDDFSGSFITLNLLYAFAKNNLFLFVLFSFIIQILFALYLNFEVNKQKLIPKKDVLTAYTYLMLSSLLPSLSLITIHFFTSFFLILPLWFIVDYNNAKQDSSQSFKIGFFTGLATFLYAPSIIFIFLFLFLLYQVHHYQIKDFVAKLLGLFSPFVIYFSISFLNDTFDEAIKTAQLDIHFPITISNTLPSIVFISLIIIILLFSLISYSINLSKYSTVARKKIQMNILFLFISILIALIYDKLPNTAFLLIISPFTILLRQTFHVGKEKMNNFAFWILTILTVGFQLFILR